MTHLGQVHGLEKRDVHERVHRPPTARAERLRGYGEEELDSAGSDGVVARVSLEVLRLRTGYGLHTLGRSGLQLYELDLSKQIYQILVSLYGYLGEDVILNSCLDLSGQIDQLDPHFII